jgi:hypothetical protein
MADPLPDSILAVTVMLAACAAGFQGVAHVANAALFEYSVQLLDADYDHSAFGWAGSAATIAGLPAALLLVALNRSSRGSFMALAGALCFLSLDDAVFLHERVAELDTTLGLGSAGGRLVWPVLYLPLLAGVLFVLLTVARQAPVAAGTQLGAGAGMLAVAIAFEVCSYGLVRVGFGFRDWPFAIEIVLEEGLELAGWILIAGALTATAAAALIERGRRAAA